MIRKFGAALIIFMMCVTAAVALPTYTGFTTRSSGYVVTDTDWNGEFGNFIAAYNTYAIGTLNLILGKGRILTSDGTNVTALTNAGAADDTKVLTLSSAAANGLVWSAPAGVGLTTTGDTLYYSGGNQRRAIGTEGQVYTVVSGVPNWATSTSAFSTGMVMLWGGSIASIPSGWHLCDGTAGTINLEGLFVCGAGNISPGATNGFGLLPVGSTGGGTAHTHTFADTSNIPSSVATVAGGGNSVASSSHTHSVSGTTSSATTAPSFYALCYIQKI